MITKKYLKTVKRKENRSWKLSELAKIYTMRVRDNKPAIKVARKFKATLTQVYNITRMMRKHVQDMCYRCGHQLTDREMMSRHPKHVFHLCFSCREETTVYKREMREERLKRKLCGVCGKRKLPYDDAKTCLKCLSSTYRRNLKKGLCGHCGKHPHNPGKSLCNLCAETMRIKASLRRKTI